MYNSIYFYITAFLIITFLIFTIKSKNIFYSLLSAIGVFFLAAVVFYTLGSEYNAIIQVAVYGFAVPVILGLAIMFTDYKVCEPGKNLNKLYILATFSGIFVLALLYLTLTSLVVSPDGFNITEDSFYSISGSVHIIAKGLFNRFVLGLELVSVILTILVAGLTVYKKEVKNDN